MLYKQYQIAMNGQLLDPTEARELPGRGRAGTAQLQAPACSWHLLFSKLSGLYTLGGA
jgi:hypothetical protein